MTTEEYNRIEALFTEALGLPPEQRASFLDAHADDTSIRQQVERMLMMDAQSCPTFETPAMQSVLYSGLRSGDDDAPLPQRIGSYRIIRRLGAGGMGIVYEAEQDAPRRRVALKVMRPGAVSRQTLRRFEVEAHVLGQLQHPGIAQIYESGVATSADESGNEVGARPYFVMEMIEGKPLREHARDQRATIRDRLLLIAQIAEAVHHAHQKGVIHRDLKPDNVLVTEEGQPKVLDFGVARATDLDVMVTTLQTHAGQIIGTLAYMSPEQVAGRPEMLDARSDVYSLGVLMYEMLTGALPLDVTRASVPAALRMIQEAEPRRLSEFNVRLRGDLETIVAKAMEKDRSRRYQSALDFAGDIRRYLNDQPIIARPASALYQFRKFAKRNKAVVTGAAAAFISITIGMIIATWFAVEASSQRSDAEQARDDLKRQRDAAREVAYRSTIAAASASLAAGDFQAAQSHLEQAIAEPAGANGGGSSPGWEWRHLRLQLDGASLVIDQPDGPVSELTLFPHEDRYYLYVAAGNAVKVFDTGDGSLKEHIPLGEHRAVRLAISPDGTLLLLELHPVERGAALPQVAMLRLDHAAGLESPATELWRRARAAAGRHVFSPDGRQVVVALIEDEAIAWLDAQDGSELTRFPIEGGAPVRVAYSPGDDEPNAVMFATSLPNNLGVTGLVSDDGEVTITTRVHFYSHAAFAPALRKIAWEVWTDGRVITADLRHGGIDQVPQRPGRERKPLAWHTPRTDARNAWLAVGDENEVLIWDVVQWEPFALLPGHERTVTSGCFSQDGRILVTGDAGGTIRVWSMPPTSSPWIVHRWDHWAQACGRLSPDGRTLATVGWSILRLWNVPEGTLRATYNLGSRYVDDVAFNSDGSFLAVSSRDRGLRVIEVLSADAAPGETGRVVLETDLIGNRPLAWAAADIIGRDTDALLWLNPGGVLEAYEIRLPESGTPSYERLSVFEFSPAPMHLMAVEDTHVFALAWSPTQAPPSEQQSKIQYHLIAFDLQSGRQIAEVTDSGDRPSSIALHGGTSPMIAIGDEGGHVHLWRLAPTGLEPIWSARSTGAAIRSLAFTQDGSRVAAGRVAAVDLLDSASGTTVASIPHKIGRVVGLGFTDHDAALVACGEDHPLAIFDAAGMAGEPRLPSELLAERSEFRQARLIADPLFESLLARSRVLAALETDSLSPWQLEAATAYTKRRDDHRSGLANDAIFAIRRGDYASALVRYEALRAQQNSLAPVWNSFCAKLHYLLGEHDKAETSLAEFMEWPMHIDYIGPADWALAALIAHHHGITDAASNAWKSALDAATTDGEPSFELDRAIWDEAKSRFASGRG